GTRQSGEAVHLLPSVKPGLLYCIVGLPRPRKQEVGGAPDDTAEALDQPVERLGVAETGAMDALVVLVVLYAVLHPMLLWPIASVSSASHQTVYGLRQEGSPWECGQRTGHIGCTWALEEC